LAEIFVLPIYLFGTINLQLHTSLNVSDANARLPFRNGQIGQTPITATQQKQQTTTITTTKIH